MLQNLVILPVGFFVTPDETLSDGIRPLGRHLLWFLESIGRVTTKIEYEDALELWKEAAESTGGLVDERGAAEVEHLIRGDQDDQEDGEADDELDEGQSPLGLA